MGRGEPIQFMVVTDCVQTHNWLARCCQKFKWAELPEVKAGEGGGGGGGGGGQRGGVGGGGLVGGGWGVETKYCRKRMQNYIKAC